MASSARVPIPPTDGDVTPDVQASRRAAMAARRVAGALVTGRASAAALDDAAAQLETLAAQLEPTAAESCYDGADELGFAPRADPRFFERHPFLGWSNPLAPPLVLEPIPDGTAGLVTLDGRHEGVPGFVHGGWISALFDQVVGIAGATVGGRPAMTGTLTVRFLHPTPVGTELRFTATARRSGERTVQATATLTAAGRVTAEADATLVWPRPERLERERSRRP